MNMELKKWAVGGLFMLGLLVVSGTASFLFVRWPEATSATFIVGILVGVAYVVGDQIVTGMKW